MITWEKIPGSPHVDIFTFRSRKYWEWGYSWQVYTRAKYQILKNQSSFPIFLLIFHVNACKNWRKRPRIHCSYMHLISAYSSRGIMWGCVKWRPISCGYELWRYIYLLLILYLQRDERWFPSPLPRPSNPSAYRSNTTGRSITCLLLEQCYSCCTLITIKTATKMTPVLIAWTTLLTQDNVPTTSVRYNFVRQIITCQNP